MSPLNAVVLLSAALALAVYALLLRHPQFSPRSLMVRRLGPTPVDGGLTPSETRLAGKLRQVPLTRRVSPRWFRRLQAGLAGGAGLVILAPWLLLGLRVNWGGLALYPALLWVLPEVWLLLQLRRRHALIARTYPDLLAHLATQTRAGAGTLQAFATVPPVLREPLRAEVEELLADLRIAPFPAALERFAGRCGISELNAFAKHVIHQQAMGIALPEVLAAEEAHTLAMAKQAVRKRIQGSAIVMAAVTVILLLNGLMIYLTPVAYDLSRLISQR